MSKLTRESKHLVREARAGGDPSAADQARIRAALVGRIGVPVPEPAPSTAPIVNRDGRSRWSWGAKVVTGLGIALITGANAFDRGAPPEATAIAMPVHSAAALPLSILEPIPPDAEPREVPSEEPRARPVVPSRSQAPLASPSKARGSVAEEIALIGRAHEALQAGNADEALSRLDEHARRFPNGVLAEERASERVLALCASGRVAQARVEGERFLREHPESPAATRVRASCSSERSKGKLHDGLE